MGLAFCILFSAQATITICIDNIIQKVCHLSLTPSRLPDAKQFLQHRVEFLQALLSADNPTAHAPLASCYQKLGQYEDAVEHAQLAVKSDQQNKETKWLLELVMRQRTNLERRRKMQHQLQKQATLQMPKPIQVLFQLST